MENTIKKKEIDLTDEQKAAISVQGKTLLVSAAAGSGKTFTLTQRIIKEIVEDDRDISRMLIVTFTRSAAADLRAKVSKAIQNTIQNETDKDSRDETPQQTEKRMKKIEKLQSQLIKLSSSHISTIDSFFTVPVRSNFEKLGLPASIRLADEAELEPLREELMNQTIEEFFKSCDLYSDGDLSDIVAQSSFTDLLSIISTARDSSTLVPTFIDIYKKLMSSSVGVEQLKNHADRMRSASVLNFFDTDEGKIIRTYLISVAEYTKKSFEQCCTDFDNIPFVKENYLACFINDGEKCAELIAALETCDFNKAKDAFDNFSPQRIPSIKAQDKTEESIYYYEKRKKLYESLKRKFKEIFSFTEEDISEFFLQSSELCTVLYSLLKAFDKNYCEEKLSKGICEFSDMPKYMLKLLQNPDGTPTQYCLSLRESFDEVYIDEYQDVNDIQNTIFSLIGGSHRFMVGDIKQSIYGFREADPEIFKKYRNDFITYDVNDPASVAADENTIFMSSNFRCDKNVVDFTNDVCSKVFSAFSDSIKYTSKDDLKFGKPDLPQNYVGPRVKINIVHQIDNDDDNENELDEIIDEQEDIKNQKEISEAKSLSDEACIVANEIAYLLRCGKKPDGKPIKGKDIAVLVRSHKSALPLILALNKLNIKYTTSAGKYAFSDQKMILLMDLLSVIDNPRSDLPLYRLMSTQNEGTPPILSMEELIIIRHSVSKSRSLFDAMINYAEQKEQNALSKKCAEIIDEFDGLRRLATKLSADKLMRILPAIERYSDLTDSSAFISLYDKACQFVRRSWNGLSSFLLYLNKLAETGDSAADTSGSDGNEINILSMHQSKGLEFSACFLFALGKEKNSQDSKKPLIYSKDLGISIKLPAKKTLDDPLGSIKVRYNSNPIWKAGCICCNIKQAEEEARILYVALTRARERLYLSASTRKSFEQEITNAKRSVDLDFSVRNAKRYIDMIFLSLAEKNWDNDVFFCELTEKGNAVFTSPLKTNELDARDQEGEKDNKEKNLEETKKKIHDNFSRIYLNSCKNNNSGTDLSMIPAKVAASKASGTMLDNSIFLPETDQNNLSGKPSEADSQAIETKKSIEKRIELMSSQKNDLDDILASAAEATAAEKGTATHLFLQYCDYSLVEKYGVEAEKERLVNEHFISRRAADFINSQHLTKFFKSELFSYIASSSKVYHEFKFGMFRPASDFTSNAEKKKLVKDKKLFVQGSIDLIIEMENGDLYLCDYKTDKISKKEQSDKDLLIKSMKSKHGDQLEQYQYAVKQIFGRSPQKTFIYSTPLGEVIEIK